MIEKLQGAKLIADFEARYDHSDTAARQQLLELSERYGIASSEMSLVAVVERTDDQSGDVPKTKIVAVGLPQDTRFGSYFGDAARCCFRAAEPGAGPLYSSGSGVRFSIAVEASLGPPERPIWVPGMLADIDVNLSDALCETLRAVVGMIDTCTSTPSSKDVTTDLDSLLGNLVFHEGQIEKEIQKEALAALIDFLSSDMIDFLDTGCLDVHKWQVVRRRLEQAWPELANAKIFLSPLAHE